jgi:hypothetical protein
MKTKLFPLLILLFFLQAFCNPLTYYGPSGYIFVPNGFVASDWKYTGFTGGELVSLQNVRLYPRYLAFRSSAFDDKLEISFSSVYRFVEDNGYEPKKILDGLLPVVPAVKWNIADNRGNIVRAGYSVGLVYAYGFYFSTTTQFAKLPILQPEFTIAASLWTERGYGMVGTRLQSADFSGKPLPIALTAEAAWASSMSSIGQTTESFMAYGTELNLGKNLTLLGAFRKDLSTYYNYDEEGNRDTKKDGQNTNGKWSLRLDFHFDGIKNAGGKEQL